MGKLFNHGSYGLDIIVSDSFVEAFSLMQKYRGQIRCSFVIQDKKIDSKSSISGLNMEGEVPLFLLFPSVLIAMHKQLCQRMDNVFFCAWEGVLGRAVSSLHREIEQVFTRHGIGELFVRHIPYRELQPRIERRMKSLNTLPTLPEVALRIMKMVDDPASTVEELEEVLMTDPAIVHKLLHVINSPIFAGSGHKGGWSLQEAIVRLGRRKVGAIAQQIKLMNSLVKPEKSLFDLRRFWEHSVGCAMMADKLYTDGLIPLKASIEFNDYWIGGLLHDCGKLVLGFFFWDHFEEVLEHMGRVRCSFREAEKAFGDVANHEYLGRLLLMSANVGQELVEAVGTHHSIGDAPGKLACLLHLANNICKDLGLGYLVGEQTVYSAPVLRALGLEKEDVLNLRRSIGGSMVEEIRQVVDRCTH